MRPPSWVERASGSGGVTTDAMLSHDGRATPTPSRPVGLAALMVVAMAVDLAFQHATHQVTPGLFLLPAVIVIAAVAGLTAGLTAAAAAVAFAAVDLAEDGPLWQAPYDRTVRLVVLCATAPATAVVVGLLRRRVEVSIADHLRGRVDAERDRAAVRAAADGRAFATERDRLQSERDALADADRQTQRRLSDLIAAVPGVVWEAVVDGPRLRIAFISRHVEDLLGYDVRQWTDSPDLWWSAVHPDDRDRVRLWLSEACGGEAAATSNAAPVEYRWVARDGSPLWVETRVAAVAGPTADRKCVALRGVTSDITARKRLQAAVEDRAAELAAVARCLQERNVELDQFAYVTSHDLKAPLRGIANLSNWIEEDLGDRTTPEAHGQFDLLRGRVQRMERLIDGLLHYSRVDRTESVIEWVDIGRLLADVVDWVGPPATVRVEIGAGMPTFNCDRLRLEQVLANLVGNAVKHHGGTPGWVRVCCSAILPTAGHALDGYEFAVSDDGPGIDPRYHERIFGVFQTLQRRDKVEGTGIGLAVVRKVVAGKGGTVRVESAAGEGATFRFTWPRVDPAERRPTPGGTPTVGSPGRPS